MSGFFGKLINRHQQGAERDVASFVTPRPKSRFENQPVGSHQGQQALGDDMALATIKEGASLLSQREPQNDRQAEQGQVSINEKNYPAKPQNSEKTARSKTHAREFEPLNDLSKIDALASQQQSRDVSLSLSKIDTQTTRPALENQRAFEGLNQASDQYDNNLIATDELDLRIQSILKRLGKPAAVQTVLPTERGADEFPSQVSTDINSQTQPQLAETPQDQTTREPQPLSNTDTFEQSEYSQNGVLQPPSWLSDIRNDISQRWQDINTQVKPTEPVVNVTIGRVEVKAAQPSSAQQPRKKKKPSGVMSLDDYLKERA